MKSENSSTIALAAILGLVLSGCDWVDSNGSSESTPVVVTEVLLDDIPAGDVIVLNENDEARITVSSNAAPGSERTYLWSDQPLEEGNLPACENQGGFNAALAADSLLQACRSSTECDFSDELVNSEPDSDNVVFSWRVPTLDASVGLIHELSITDALGNTDTIERIFCLIAINEEPVANDDNFVITEGETLNITLDAVNLLTNDEDDTDVSNSPLTVLSEPVEAPAFATFFELGADGSFTYQSSSAGATEDSFVYQITDGVFPAALTDGATSSTATVTINIVAANEAPQQLSIIPPLAATEGVAFSSDLAELFLDPEGSDITFALSTMTPLAAGSGLSLSAAGVLSGVPTLADVGSYALSVVVSDGSLASVADLTLEVAGEPVLPPNSPPVFVPQTVSNRTVESGLFIMPIQPEFTDVDGDVLTYSLADNGVLPNRLTIDSATGLIRGRATQEGVFSNLMVRATDTAGNSALSSSFSITVMAAGAQ